MLRPDTFALTAFLGLLTGLGPATIDLYLPALPEIGADLGASTASVQLTISVYLVGFAVGQIVYGPLSDVRGRRPVLLVALIIYCVASLLCALAPTIHLLMAARAVQAIGACGAIVLARAVVRDLYSGTRAGREMAVMGMITGVAPIIAPTIGGLLQAAFGWRACFLSLAGGGAVAFASAWLLLPETAPVNTTKPVTIADLWAGYGVVLRHRAFHAYQALITLTFCGLFAYLSGSPFVLQGIFGLTPIEFAGAFAVSAAGGLVGNTLSAHIVSRIGVRRTLDAGTAVLAAAGIALAAASVLTPGSPFGIIVPMVLYMIGLGMTIPQAFAGVLQPFPRHAGTASSLAGFIQQSIAAAVGALVGHLLGHTAWPMVAVIACAGCLTFLCWRFAAAHAGEGAAE